MAVANPPCEQWFLQAGRYASMGKKPLRATVCFPSSMRVHVMTTNIQRQDGNENFNKKIGLISKTATFHLSTRIWVRAMIGLEKSHCQFANQVGGKFETHFR